MSDLEWGSVNLVDALAGSADFNPPLPIRRAVAVSNVDALIF